MSERGRRRPAIDLPQPYPGVFNEIVSEVAFNLEDFTRTVRARMSGENPHLMAHTAQGIILSPEPDITRRWTLIYYDIYSRSAQKKGTKMSFVTQKSIDDLARERSDRLDEPLRTGNKDALRKYMQECREESERLKVSEMLKSDELASFWQILSVLKYSHRRLYDVDLEDITLEPLDRTLLLLHR